MLCLNYLTQSSQHCSEDDMNFSGFWDGKPGKGSEGEQEGEREGEGEITLFISVFPVL